MAPIRVLVADDHALFRAGVRKLLQSFEGMDVVVRPPTARRRSV